QAQTELWYQAFHQLPLAAQLVDGDTDAVRAYLGHFWHHWSGPDFQLSDDELDTLVSDYALPGAFCASIAWYRAGAGTIIESLTELPPEGAAKIGIPTAVLWPRLDPLFPLQWADRLDQYFSDAELYPVDGVGHFTPLECPQRFAELVLGHVNTRPETGPAPGR
nr:alpha/beta hydrolase [Actinomycetes bacterium]